MMKCRMDQSWSRFLEINHDQSRAVWQLPVVYYPLQSYRVAAIWLVPIYTAWWDRGKECKQLAGSIEKCRLTLFSTYFDDFAISHIDCEI